MTLNKNDILAASDIEVAEIEIPQWGGTIHVKGMNGRQRGIFETSAVRFVRENKADAMSGMREQIAAWCICDENGKRLFSDDDAAKLGEKSGEALDLILEKVLQLSKINVPRETIQENFTDIPRD